MILRKSETKPKESENCHGGEGMLFCREMLADYNKKNSGYKYIHDNILDPGASIGAHTHEGDEELYIILTGQGVMEIDGVETPVGPGDVCITRHGHSHSLKNSKDGPMHMLVICTNL